MQQTCVQFLGQEDLLEKEMATHSSVPAWRISWTEEPGGLQSMGSQESDTTEWLDHHHHIFQVVMVSYEVSRIVQKYSMLYWFGSHYSY